jgi:hypothetical protein
MMPMKIKRPGFGLPKAKGSRLRVQGKINKRKLTVSLYLAPYDAKREAQSAKRKTMIIKASSVCTLCAMRYALCGLTWPQGPGFQC